MTGGTAFEADRPMLERERTTLVAVAGDAAGFVRGECLRRRGLECPMRIVAIDAAHGAFGELVMIGPLELRPDVQVAARTFFVDRGRLARDQVGSTVLVHFVTSGAG